MKVQLTILGEPASKANSRQLVTFGKAAPLRETLQSMLQEAIDCTDWATAAKRWVERARHALSIGEDSRPAIIKSKKARDYEHDAMKQIPRELRVMMTGPVRVTLKIYYASERPDLDESVVLDVLQTKFEKATREVKRPGVYLNDRQVREKHVYHAIDRNNPRAEIEVEEINAGLFESMPEVAAPIPSKRRDHSARSDRGHPSIAAGADPF